MDWSIFWSVCGTLGGSVLIAVLQIGAENDLHPERPAVGHFTHAVA